MQYTVKQNVKLNKKKLGMYAKAFFKIENVKWQPSVFRSVRDGGDIMNLLSSFLVELETISITAGSTFRVFKTCKWLFFNLL